MTKRIFSRHQLPEGRNGKPESSFCLPPQIGPQRRFFMLFPNGFFFLSNKWDAQRF